MSLRKLVVSNKSRKADVATLRRHRLRKLNLENLETRNLMATYVVNSPLDLLSEDPEVVTLRSAIQQANSNFGEDTIEFDLGSEPSVITLNSELGTLEVFGSLNIVGPGASQLIIDGGFTNESNGVRILELFVDQEEGILTRVDISGVTLRNGNAGNFEADGGAIYNHSTELWIVDSILDSNRGGNGGAIYHGNEDVTIDQFENINYGFVPLYISNTRLANNTAITGGAIYNDHGHVEIFDGSLVSGNLAFQDAGAVYTVGVPNRIQPSTLIVDDSVFSNNTAQDGSGGAVYTEDDHVEFNNSSVINNQAGLDGGAIYSYNTGSLILGTVKLFQSIASGNSAGARGGAIYAAGDTVNVFSSQLLNNSATAGGAIYVGPSLRSFGYLDVQDSLLQGNEAAGLAGGDARGGALFIAPGSNSFIGRSQLRNNSARGGNSVDTAGSGLGGAIYAENSVSINFSTISGNVASGGDGAVAGKGEGGGVWTNHRYGSYTFSSTISDNLAVGGDGTSVGGSAFGGGYFGQFAGTNEATFATHQIEATLINNNAAEKGAGAEAFADGGGVWISDGLAMINSTISGNRADDDGGGIHFGPSTIVDGIVQVRFSTIVNNQADVDGDEEGTGGGLRINTDFLPTLVSSIVSLNTVGGQDDNVAGALAPSVSVGNLINDDPLIGPLANNGGPTRTHALLAGSPAIGQAVPVEFLLDQRGLQRFSPFDIGAYELSFDFGDANSGQVVTYPTAGEGAARHAISNLYLGSISNNGAVPVDADNDGSLAPAAAGDDNDDFNDDEDGVRFATAAAGFLARVDVVSSGPGYLNAWIDFNADGIWDDPSTSADDMEHIFAGIAVAAGTNALTFSVPSLTSPLPEAYARFRLSSVQYTNLTPGGDAPDGSILDGEVEDYRLSVQTVILPDGSTEGSFTFTDTVPARVRRTYDPFVATGYDYEVTSGPSFAEVEVFAGFGDSVYTLLVDDPANPGTFVQVPMALHGGEVFDFATLDSALQVPGGGVRKFRLTGIETSAALDPESPTAFPTAISFIDGGDVAFTQTPLTVFVNSPATIVGTSTGTISEDEIGSVGGDLDVVDIDEGHDVFQTPESLAGTYGTFTFDVISGVWSYQIDNAAVNALAAEENFDETLTVTSFDGTASVVITVTITGANDAATIIGTSTAEVTEDASSNEVSGDLDVEDVDSPADFQVPASLAGVYGFFSFNAATGAWSYSLDNLDPDTNHLSGGEIVEDSISVTSSDGTATQSIVITITGNNDVATITGTRTGSLTEDASTNLASGDLDVSDVDSPNTFEEPLATAFQGLYGVFTFNTTDGVWTYTLDNADPDTNALAAGQTVGDVLLVKSSDGTAEATIGVTITGTNDAASITGTSTTSRTEDAAVTTVGGDLDVSDVDSPQEFQIPGSLAGTYGTFGFNSTTGAWIYLLDNANPATNALAGGQVVHDTLVVTSSDGTASVTIDVTITGNNDAASITGTATGALTEDAATTTATGDLNVVDPDSPTTFQTPASLAGTYGNFTFNSATGEWTYVLNNADADTNALSTGQIVHDTLTVTSQDGTASKVIDVTITGVTDGATNTPPVAILTAPTRGVRGQELSFTLAATDTAADQAAGFTYKVVWGDGTPDTIIARTAGNAAGVTVTHTFTRSANFSVMLIATDQGGKVSTPVVKTVSVTSAAIQTTAAGSVLVVGGTTSSDLIGIYKWGSSIDVWINLVKTRFTQAVSRILVYAQAGNDIVNIGSDITTPSYINGGDGNDTLVAGGGRSILLGGAGDDLLWGGSSRDLLIGGSGKDKLYGSSGGDILIGARSSHENNVDTLFSILTAWNANSTYTNRVNSLSGLLNTTTVVNDSAEDVLNGSTGTDWFFARRSGTARDTVFAALGERITEI